MINLLPPDYKTEIQAARMNRALVGYLLFTIMGAAFLVASLAGTYYLLTQTRDSADIAREQNESRFSEVMEAQQQASELRSNLAMAKSILDSEITYSDILLDIAALMPSGTILDELKLDKNIFGSETTITAYSRTNESALALKESFEKSDLFSNVSFQNISQSSSNENRDYPYTVSLNVTFRNRTY